MQDKRPLIAIFCANSYVDGKHLSYLIKERQDIYDCLDDSAWSKIHEGNTGKARFFEQLSNYQNKNRLTILHFAGHAKGEQLILESQEGEKEELSAETLGEFLRPFYPKPTLIFLNGCATKTLVEKLLNIGIPAVLATQSAVEDEHASEVAVKFYKYLRHGWTIQESYEHAKNLAKDKFDKSLGLIEFPNSNPYRGFVRGDIDEFPWALFYHEENKKVLKWRLPVNKKSAEEKVEILQRELEEYKKGLVQKEFDLEGESKNIQNLKKVKEDAIQELDKEALDYKEIIDKLKQEILQNPSQAEEMMRTISMCESRRNEKKKEREGLESEEIDTAKLDLLRTEVREYERLIKETEQNLRTASKASNKIILKDTLRDLNFDEQRTKYINFSNSGLWQEIILIQGAKNSGQDFLIGRFEEWARFKANPNKRKVKISLRRKDFTFEDDKVIWKTIRRELKLNHVNDNDRELESKICNIIYETLKTREVVIQFDPFHEVPLKFIIPILKSFWETLNTYFPDEPDSSKCGIFMLLVDRKHEEENIYQNYLPQLKNLKSKYIKSTVSPSTFQKNESAFLHMPPIPKLNPTEYGKWVTRHLGDTRKLPERLQSGMLSFIDSLPQEGQYLQPAITEICKALELDISYDSLFK